MIFCTHGEEIEKSWTNSCVSKGFYLVEFQKRKNQTLYVHVRDSELKMVNSCTKNKVVVLENELRRNIIHDIHGVI